MLLDRCFIKNANVYNPVAQSVVSLIAGPGVVIQSRPSQVYYGIIFMVILLLLRQEGHFCQLQAIVCAQSAGYPFSLTCPGKNVVRLTDHLNMTIAVDWNVNS